MTSNRIKASRIVRAENVGGIQQILRNFCSFQSITFVSSSQGQVSKIIKGFLDIAFLDILLTGFK